jgi:hypothetical protein
MQAATSGFHCLQARHARAGSNDEIVMKYGYSVGNGLPGTCL